MKQFTGIRRSAVYFAVAGVLAGCGEGTPTSLESEIGVNASSQSSALDVNGSASSSGVVTVETISSPIIARPGLPELGAANLSNLGTENEAEGPDTDAVAVDSDTDIETNTSSNFDQDPVVIPAAVQQGVEDTDEVIDVVVPEVVLPEVAEAVAPVDEVENAVEEDVEIPPVEETIEEAVDVPPVEEIVEEAIEVPPAEETVEEVVDVPPVEETVEEVVDVPPVEETVEEVIDVPPLEETVEEAVDVPPVEEVVDEVVDNRNTVIVGSNPGDAQCLNFGDKAIGFGSLKDDDWRNWMPGFRFAIGEEFLSVEVDEDGNSNLRHKYVPWERGTERVVMGADLPKYTTYRITEKVFFEPGWEWGGDTYEGGKLAFGFGGGATPSGGIIDPAGFTARIMWRGNYLGGGEYDGTGRFVVYSYAADRPERVGEDIFFDNYIVPIGEWIQITYEVKANSSINKSDGHVRTWVNGELMLDNKNMGWQLAGDKPGIDTFYYSSFYGGSNPGWAPSKPTYAKVKDVCWAPVVDGYSGINPDDGMLYVDPASTGSPVFNDGIELPRWSALQKELLSLVEEAKALLQITAPSADITAQDNYKNAVAGANAAVLSAEQIASISLGSNPIIGISQALSELDTALTRTSATLYEIDDAVLIKERLQAALFKTTEVAIEVAKNYQSTKSCDEASIALNCFESRSLLDEARNLSEQANNAGRDWVAYVSPLTMSWERSVEAIESLK